MCMRCNGYSQEDLDRQQDLAIRVNGYSYIHVYDPGDPKGIDGTWTYTLGILEGFGQPDFIVLGIDTDKQVALIKALAESIVVGAFSKAILAELDVSLATVHEDHFPDGLVGEWEDRYGPAQRGDFVQIVPGDSWYCRCCPGVEMMDDPTPLSGAGYRGRPD